MPPRIEHPAPHQCCRHRRGRLHRSHLSEALLDRGYTVIGIDNFLTGDRQNIEHLRGRDFRLVEQDVARYIDVDERVDWVLHWASPASPADYLAYPIQTLKAGALGTHNALGTGARQARDLRAGIHLGGIRRPGGAPAAGDVTGVT